MKSIQKTTMFIGDWRLGFVLKVATLLLSQCVLLLARPVFAGQVPALQFSSAVTNTQALASEEYKKSPYLKPGAPVQLQSPNQYIVTVGQSLSLELALGLLVDGEATFTFKADNGLDVAGASTLTVKGKKQAVVPLEVTLTKASLSYLHIFVDFKGALGQETRRTFAVAFDSRGQQPLQFKTTQPKPFVELQAQETIY